VALDIYAHEVIIKQNQCAELRTRAATATGAAAAAVAVPVVFSLLFTSPAEYRATKRQGCALVLKIRTCEIKSSAMASPQACDEGTRQEDRAPAEKKTTSWPVARVAVIGSIAWRPGTALLPDPRLPAAGDTPSMPSTAAPAQKKAGTWITTRDREIYNANRAGKEILAHES
jgi:hypothetical protein